LTELNLSGNALLLAATNITVDGGWNILIFLFLLVLFAIATVVLGGWYPHAGFSVFHRLVLVGKIDTVTLDAVLTALRQSSGASGEFRADGCILCHPVGESIFAVLDDTVRLSKNVTNERKKVTIRLASFVSVVRVPGFTRSDWSVINKLEQMFSVSSDNGKLLAMLTESIELVGKGSLELLASDVGQLSFGDKGFGFSADKLLLKDEEVKADERLFSE